MNILFSCDKNYVMPLAVCLTSLFENNPKNKVGLINIYILHSSLLEKQKEEIKTLIYSYGQNLHLIQVDEHYFDTAPLFSWTKETYYRLLINEYLPKDLEKILYLDCDTIVIKLLLDLYNIDLGDNFVGAVEEKNQSKLRVLLGLKAEGQYFNAGVVLFDLKKCREILNYKKASEVIKNIGKNFFKADEGVLNVIFENKIKTLDLKYNNYSITDFEGKNINRLFNLENQKALAETYILHFFTKPWYNLYPASCEQIWYKYLRLSPYKDLYDEKFNTLKYKILKLGCVKAFIHMCFFFLPIIEKVILKAFPKKIHKAMKNFYIRHIR